MCGFALFDLDQMQECATTWIQNHDESLTLARKHYPTARSLRTRAADSENFNRAVMAYGDAQSEFFRLLEGMLSMYGRISLLLFPQAEERHAERALRGISLRTALQIDKTHSIGDRAFRNKWLHFDEVLDSLPISGSLVAQRFQHSKEVSDSDRATTIRLFLIDRMEVCYLGIGTFGLKDLRGVIEDVRTRALKAIGSWALRRGLVEDSERNSPNLDGADST
jgi:hypothetical protein